MQVRKRRAEPNSAAQRSDICMYVSLLLSQNHKLHKKKKGRGKKKLKCPAKWEWEWEWKAPPSMTTCGSSIAPPLYPPTPVPPPCPFPCAPANNQTPTPAVKQTRPQPAIRNPHGVFSYRLRLQPGKSKLAPPSRCPPPTPSTRQL